MHLINMDFGEFIKAVFLYCLKFFRSGFSTFR